MLRRSLILGQFSTTVRPYFVAFQRLGVQELQIVSRPYASDSSGRDGSKCETPPKKAPVYNADCIRPRDTSCEPTKGYPCSNFGRQPEPSNKPPCHSSMKGMMPEEEEPDPEKVRKRNLWLLLGMLVVASGLYKMIDWKNLFTPAQETKRVEVGKPKRPRKLVKKPTTSTAIPDEVPYLLIGGGTASFSAFRAIKSLEPQAKVLVVTSEPFNPYMRPPLSKEMFYGPAQEGLNALNFKQWNGTERSLFYEPDDFYMQPNMLHKEENGGVAVAQGWTVTKLDVVSRVATLDDGKKIKYGKCLIATGAQPRTMPVFEDVIDEVKPKVSLYRGIHDYEDIESVIASGAKTIAIFGGGFLGSELACSLARRGRSQNMNVVQIYKESGNMSKILPKYLSDWTTKKVKAEGVELHPNTEIDDIDLAKSKKEIVLMLSDKRKIIADHLIVAVGCEPNTELALSSQLETDPELGGYLVNAELEARSGVYVAGDAACFYDVKLGRRRVEHHDHAVVSGRLAGENMTGAGKPYWHQSMFWSDLGPDVGYEAIGIVDSSLPTFGVYARPSSDDNPKAAGKPSGDGMRSSDEEGGGESAAKKPGEAAAGAPKPGEDYGKGVIFYLRDDIVVGIVLWNVFNRMQVARQVLMQEQKFDDLNEVAKLFNIHASDTQTDTQTAAN